MVTQSASARNQSRSDVPCEDHVFVFGTFRFLPRLQLLLRDGQPVKLGGRAMDILHLLLKSAGEPVAKRALEQFAWPDTFVHESNLKVHISSLRRALGETSPQPTYISTVAGRGYRFIPRVSIEPIVTAGVLSDGVPFLDSLPPQRPPIGREREIDRVASMLERSRLVTLVGPGGVGKTTVALAAARRFHEEGVSSVVFIDLSRVASQEFVTASLAAALGISAGGDDSLHAVVSILARRTALLLLDTCEHVLTAATRICDVLLAKTGNVRILATSRQVLGAQLEKVVWLAPLDLPPKEASTSQEILKYSACQLLAARASENADYRLADADAQAIAEICRRVDGMPLAIELVSSRLALRTADGVLDELDDRFRTLRRPAPGSPLRQQTLLVTLEWSYALLTQDEATVLRAVSIFAGAFDPSWAHVVICRRFASIDTWAIIDGLRAKSMLSVFARSSGEPRYRLLDTTRAFAGSLLDSHGELAAVSADHARLQLEIFTRAGADQATMAVHDWRETYLEQADDLRKAIDWALYRSGDVQLGIRLVAAGLPLWNELSLFDENRRNCERALSELEGSGSNDAPLKLKLVVGLAGVYAYLSGDPRATIALFETAIQLARDLSDASVESRALGALAIYFFLPGRHEELSETLRVMELAAMRSKDRTVLWEYEQLCADLETTRGDFSASRSRLERLSTQMRNHAEGAAPRFHIHQTAKIDAHLAALYWFTGKPGRAQELTEKIAAEVVEAAHGMTLIRCFCYGVIFTLVQCHDYVRARSYTEILKDTIYRHGMAAWIPVADVYSEAIQALSGVNTVPDGLRMAFDQLREAMVQIRHPSYFVTLATAMMALGQVNDAARVIDYVFQQPTQPWVSPEVLRLRAAIERASGRDADAEATLMRSLQLADETGALGWKLRAALDLAVLLKDHGAPVDAQRILISVYDQFTDGFDSGDLRNARSFLQHVG